MLGLGWVRNSQHFVEAGGPQTGGVEAGATIRVSGTCLVSNRIQFIFETKHKFQNDVMKSHIFITTSSYLFHSYFTFTSQLAHIGTAIVTYIS
jgi:hypothetical protein